MWSNYNLTIDDTPLQRIDELSKRYKATYNKEVDYTVIPKGITQEKLIKCLELMISDNLSLTVAYNKLERGNYE